MQETPESELELTPDILKEFLSETGEHLAKAEAAFVSMENNRGGKEALNSAFRSFHTIKGTADYLGFKALKDLAHFCEELLDRARSSGRIPEKNVLAWLIKTIDGIKQNFAAAVNLKKGINKGAFEGASAELLKKLSSGIIDSAARHDPSGEEDSVLDFSAAGSTEVHPDLKVDSGKFGALMNSLNELSVAEKIMRNELETFMPADTTRFENIRKRANSLSKITAKLSYDSFALKMLPFQNIFNKMTRLMRDLCVKSGKKVKLLLSGGETEIDREIIENLVDPLVHILRNAVDHGIENPQEREKNGKWAAGLVSLSASCRDGNIVISVADDGRGLNRSRILEKAVKTGLLAPGVEPDDDKIYELITAPGFSTAEKISELSGRGVGMDVVRKAVESLRGRIRIKSIEGAGTRITMTFPVNLVVIEGLAVMCCGAVYIIPAASVQSVAPATQAAPGADLINFLLCRDSNAETVSGRILVTLRAGGALKHMMVEKILAQQKIAVKNIPALRLENTIFSGATILPDGAPALIISPERLSAGA